MVRRGSRSGLHVAVADDEDAFVVGIAWLIEHEPGVGWSPLVTSLILAVTAPLALFPLVMPGNAGTVARLELVLVALAVLPLAWTLSGWVARTSQAQPVKTVAVVCVIAAVVVIIIGIGPTRHDGYLGSSIHLQDAWGGRWLLLGVATLVPGLAAANSVIGGSVAGLGSDRAVVVASVLVGASVLPMVTGVTLVSYAIWPPLVILVAAALAMMAIFARIAIGPLARSVGSATMQRNLVVAASESERYRLATALHDGPLGDVALLVQRLDTSGDPENAALARSIADDLRDVGNELRLPTVENLGVGATLEWLVARMSAAANMEIGLEVVERSRPPAAVEAATYRVAQEAVSTPSNIAHRRWQCAMRPSRSPSRSLWTTMVQAWPRMQPSKPNRTAAWGC